MSDVVVDKSKASSIARFMGPYGRHRQSEIESLFNELACGSESADRIICQEHLGQTQLHFTLTIPKSKIYPHGVYKIERIFLNKINKEQS